MHTQSYRIKNTTGVPTVGVRIHYVPTRTNIPTGAEKSVDPTGRIHIVRNLPGLLELSWPAAELAPNDSIRIEIPFQGEHINGVRLEWVPPIIGAPAPTEAVARLREQFHHRRELIRGLPDPIRGYSEFFCAMDFESIPPLESDWALGNPATHATRKAAILGLEPILQQRLRAKAAARRNQPLQPLPRAPGEHVRVIAELFLSLIDNARIFKVLPQDSGRNQRVGFAFDFFATGRLRLSGTTPSHGQPNGANIFCFAEFAFLAIEMDIEKDRFAALLSCWLRTQELFLYAYGGSKGGPAPFDSYSRTPMSPAVVVPDWHIQHLRRRYDAMETLEELEDESVRLARMAFRTVATATPLAHRTVTTRPHTHVGADTALA